MAIDVNTPWEVDAGVSILDADGYTLCLAKFPLDAEHIVRCVNAHDELVAALREAREFARQQFNSAEAEDVATAASLLCERIDAALEEA